MPRPFPLSAGHPGPEAALGAGHGLSHLTSNGLRRNES